MRKLKQDPKFMAFDALIRAECQLSKIHVDLCTAALDTHGEHGSQISGICRDHFPEDVKNALRLLCQHMERYADAAQVARPPRVRQKTLNMRARIIAKEGHGFYGPQP